MQLLKYLKSTRGLKLKLSVDDLYIVKWWVDASYAVHKEYNGNTRVMMCLGKGDVGSFTRKKRIQCNISTEDEIIGTYDAYGKQESSFEFQKSNVVVDKTGMLLRFPLSGICNEKNNNPSLCQARWHASGESFHTKRFYLV